MQIDIATHLIRPMDLYTIAVCNQGSNTRIDIDMRIDIAVCLIKCLE